LVPLFVFVEFRFVWCLSWRRGRAGLSLKHYLEGLLVS
jgi:hypothetical protein